MSLAQHRMMEKVYTLQDIIEYNFNDPLLAAEALQLPGNGVSYIGTRRLINGNKRLAVLGDVVLDMILCGKWYESGLSEAHWSAIRLRISSNSNLYAVGLHFDLGSVLQGNPRNPQAISQSIMATAVEAIIGAVSLDSNPFAVESVMNTLGLW